MKYLILISILLFTVACEKSTKDKTGSYVLPVGLEHCRIYNMSNGKGSFVTIVHCPNSTTHTNHVCGKGCTQNTTVVGE